MPPCTAPIAILLLCCCRCSDDPAELQFICRDSGIERMGRHPQGQRSLQACAGAFLGCTTTSSGNDGTQAGQRTSNSVSGGPRIAKCHSKMLSCAKSVCTSDSLRMGKLAGRAGGEGVLYQPRVLLL